MGSRPQRLIHFQLTLPTYKFYINQVLRKIFSLKKGRCIPTLAEATDNPNDPNSTIINKGRVTIFVHILLNIFGRICTKTGHTPNKGDDPSGKPINSATLMRAVTQLGAFLSVRNFGERVWNDISESWEMIAIGKQQKLYSLTPRRPLVQQLVYHVDQ